MHSEYSGIERNPIPDRPTKKQALEALSMLSFDLRWDAKEYYSKIVSRYIEQSQES